ncbi:hemolysin family protein [Abditibacterium utsteinense]|uniref:hemolysin family protein n=1 Tax=Abditibacterium utsteinense TaxID=1960156 RepID=UPI001EE6EF1C|nr:hemolysin family protein [Abditibacterium utsteinense]
MFVCLLLVGLFAASEAALAATNRVRLRHLLRLQSSDDQSAAGFLSSELSGDTQNFIATVTIAANIPLVAAASLALWAGWERYGAATAALISAAIALVAVALFQIAPRLLVSAPGALEKLWWVRPARIFVAILRPIVALMLWLGRLILAPTGLLDAAKATSEEQSNDEEIRDLVEAADAGGALEETRELIESIFTFGDTRLHEVMIPRPDIVSLPQTATPAQVMATFEETGLSRLPLYEDSIDRVAGILHIKDVLACLGEGKGEFSPLELLRAPLYLPESQKIDGALAAMRAQKTHLAIVIDEFGGTAGLLTVEDILEELVGEIADEHDRREEEPLVILDEQTALVDARFHTDDLATRWNLPLQTLEFDTVGGFMLEKLGRELRVGDRLEVAGAQLTVHSMRGRRPRKIMIVKRAEPESEA